MYGDDQAQMTMNRAAYGAVPAAMMQGAGTVYGGATMGMGNMMSDIGQYIMPITYMPPARVHMGYHGMYAQHTGLMRGLAGMVGLSSVPRGTTSLEYGVNMAGDFGERMAAGFTGGATTAGGLLIGEAMTGMTAFAGASVGAAAGSIFGPAGTLIGAGIGGVAGMMGGYFAGQGLSNMVTAGISERRGIQNFLEAASFRFAGPGHDFSDPRLGGGMSRDSRRQVSEFIRERDIADPMMNTQELTQILQQSTQLGMFAGTGSMDEFKRKFKDITESVKVVTRTLHETLEQGLQTIKDLKTIGIDPSQAGMVAQQADFAGRMSGKTGSEMISLGLQGAEMFRGTGVSMQVGFQANIMNSAAIRATRDAGLLSQEAIAQAGGEEALAQRMTAQGLAFSQSAFGRGLGGAFFNQGAGPGGFNQQGFMQAMMQGGGNFIQNAMSAANNLGSPAAIISYQANQEKFVSEMGKTFGGRGLQIGMMGGAASYAEMIAGATGASTIDAYKMYLKSQGQSAAEIEAGIAQMTGAGDVFKASMASATATRDKAMAQEAFQNSPLFRFGARVGDVAKGLANAPEKAINYLYDAAAEVSTRWYEEQVGGIQRATTAGIDLSANITSVGTASRQGPLDLDRGGLLGTTAGRNLMDTLLSNKGEAAKRLGITIKSGEAGEGDVILAKSWMTGEQTFIPKAQVGRLNDPGSFAISSTEAAEIRKSGRLEKIEGGLTRAFLEGTATNIHDMDTLSQALFHKPSKDLTKDERVKMEDEVKGTVHEKIVSDRKDKDMQLANATGALGTEGLRNARDRYDESRRGVMRDVQKAMYEVALKEGPEAANLTQFQPVEFGAGMLEKIMAAQSEGDPKKRAQMLAEVKARQMSVSQASGKPMTAEAVSLAVDVAAKSTKLDNLRSDFVSLRENRIAAGGSALYKAFEADMYAEGKVDEKVLDQVAAGVVSAESFLGLANVKGLDKTEMGATLQQQSKALNIIKSKSAADPEVKKSLEALGLKKEEIGGVLKKLASGEDSMKIVQDLHANLNLGVAGTSSMSTPGGGAAGGDAQQAFSQQVNINQQVLAIMTTLAAKIGATK